jgi:prepilin-type N-terminal cleavage/methylation domain-containing protein
MLERMRRGARKGFTLLEVLLATGIMAVGTTSILVVIAASAGMASQRQLLLRREQVVDEARHDAQAMVNAYRPQSDAVSAAGARSKKNAEKVVSAAVAPAKVENHKSDRYAGFTYDLAFEPRDRGVPEKGFDVAITLHYGDDQTHTAECTLLPTVIQDDEFADSMTYREERAGLGSQDKTKEKK